MPHRLRWRRHIAKFIRPVADVEAKRLHQWLRRFATVVAGRENENPAVVHELLDHAALPGSELALRTDTYDNGRALQTVGGDLRQRQREISVAHQVHRQP